MGLECPVCKEDYTAEEEVRQLPCNHFFHSSCIVPWLELVSADPLTCDGHLRQSHPAGGMLKRKGVVNS